MSVRVNVDTFRAAETARMFDSILAMSSGVNRWFHYRAPTPIDHQPVIRMNRDTLYSAAIVDLAGGATLTVPDTAGRYLSVMVVNAEHFIHRIYRDPGTHVLTQADHGTRHVLLAARTFVDPAHAEDVAAVNALQDRLALDAASAGAFEHPAYDPASLDETRGALITLARGVGETTRTFGSPDEVEPTRHLIGTATGWGGLPSSEAVYLLRTEPRHAGRYTLTLRDVPADAFWSVSIYNRDGFFEANPFDAYSRNSVTSEREPDGSVVLNLAPDGEGLRNHLYVMDGWNHAIRLYRPRPAATDGSWTAPEPVPAD
ncbi:MAG: DUF1254 domain-containing protein [Chloroflexota bacterium]